MMMNQIKYLLCLILWNIIFPQQGNFQILNIPSTTKLLALSNSGHAMDDIVNSYNPASITTDKKNINFHSHIYPQGIVYAKSELILPTTTSIYSFEYSNLNYGEFQDGNSKELFNSSEFLLKGSIKKTIFNKISIGTSIGYAISKISTVYSHALFSSIGMRTQLDNPRLGVGLSINNVGKIIKNFNNYQESLPQAINLSTFYKPKYFPGILCFDIYKQHGFEKIQFKSGIEFTINDYILLRIGNNSNTLDLIESYSSYFSGLSGGIGINLKKWNIDIAVYNFETAGIVTGLSLIYKK